MTDIYNTKKRSEIMSKIRGRKTKPEETVCKFLFSKGFRYRKNDKRYPGKPDIVLPKYKTIIFIHGCFWHGHKNCNASHIPKTNRYFWKRKISDNINRDKEIIKKLKNDGWKVIVIWQCGINGKKKREIRFKKLLKDLK